jgi:hypothetical protein
MSSYRGPILTLSRRYVSKLSFLYKKFIGSFIQVFEKLEKISQRDVGLFSIPTLIQKFPVYRLIDSAKTTFGTHKYKTRPDTCNKIPNVDKPWFNYECIFARQNYRKLKRKLKIKRTEALILLRYTEINFFI